MSPKSFIDIESHYDLLIDEGDDPVHDPPKLKEYMDRYDGKTFFDALGDVKGQRILEIGIGNLRQIKNDSRKSLKHRKISFRGQIKVNFRSCRYINWYKHIEI